MTTAVSGLPHQQEFTASNPEIRQHRCDNTEYQGDERFQAWRNVDRNIRAWWRNHGHEVASDHIVIFEWDVRCNLPITSLFTPFEGLLCSQIKRLDDPGERWRWFDEIPKLPPELGRHPLGVVPLGVLQFSRRALDAMCAPEFDELFAADLYCEMRTPTLLNHLGFEIRTQPSLKHVTWYPLPYIWFRKGIFHPVKTSGYNHPVYRFLRRCFGRQ